MSLLCIQLMKASLEGSKIGVSMLIESCLHSSLAENNEQDSTSEESTNLELLPRPFLSTNKHKLLMTYTP